MKIGVLALQGAFIEHIIMFGKLGVQASEIRLPEQLDGVEGLVIPGGESTTIMKLLRLYGLLEPLKAKGKKGFPILGTCAGAICLAKNVSNNHHPDMETLELIDIKVERNAFGRQIDSFETNLNIKPLGQIPFPALFIRAPIIKSVGENVNVLATLDTGVVVAAEQSNLLVTSFHPELSVDDRLHKYFISKIQGS